MLKKLLMLFLMTAFIILLSGCSEDNNDPASPPEIPKPKAAFTMNNDSCELGQSITLTNESENASSFLWDLGDGTISADKDVTHTYSEANTYTIQLKAFGEGGIDSTSKSFKVSPPPFNIIPGERIDVFILGDDLETHFSKIDESTFFHFVLQFGTGVYAHLIEFQETGIGFALISNSASLYESDIPSEISAFDPFECNTEKGITIGSTMNDVESRYGIPERILSGGSYVYDSLGIYFIPDDSDTEVEEIVIDEPSSPPLNVSLTEDNVSNLRQLYNENKPKLVDKKSILHE
jgi:PKD repeat protein